MVYSASKTAKMTKIEISDGNLTKSESSSASDESDEIRAHNSDSAAGAWSNVRSKRFKQLLGSGIALVLAFWATYIVVSSKEIDSVDVITFELTIATIICFAIAVHLHRTSIR
jgi:hypothetical protein